MVLYSLAFGQKLTDRFRRGNEGPNSGYEANSGGT